MRPLVGFHGWGFQRIMEAYAQAVKDGTVHVKTTPMRHDDPVIVGIDVGHPDGDRTAYAYRGTAGIEVVIIDDPYQEAHTYEGEFHEVSPREAMSQMAKFVEHKLPAARDTTPNRGPRPRTKYPRRR
jgi:hypothetical protein